MPRPYAGASHAAGKKRERARENDRKNYRVRKEREKNLMSGLVCLVRRVW